MVIRWLEEAAGVGSAKTYTALALQTISKQFRCLKDAIIDQIRAATNSLGEDGVKMEGLRLPHFHINNAWRPQRGLPERSVSVLRAWLFQHFLHPYKHLTLISIFCFPNSDSLFLMKCVCSYPKDSDKVMLAKQAGLTRSQVSRLFQR